MTVTIYDYQNNQPQDVDEQTAQNALLAGTHGVDTANKFKMVDSEGKTWDVPGTGITTALVNGWNLAPGNFGTAAQQRIQQNAAETGPLATFGKTALRSNTAAIIGEKGEEAVRNWSDTLTGGTPESEAEETEALRQSQKSNPTAASLGQGFGTTLGNVAQFAPAEAAGSLVERGILAGVKVATEEAVEKAATTSLTRTLVAKAANYATQGAVMSAPQTVTEAALGNPKGAAESFFWNTGLGAILGVAGAGLGKAGEALGEGLKTALPKLAEESALASAGIKTGTAEARERMAQLLQEDVITEPGMSKREIPEKLVQVAKESQEKLTALNSQFDQLIEKHPELQQYAFNPSEVAMKVENAIASSVVTPAAEEGRAVLNKLVSQIGNKDYAKGIVSFSEANKINDAIPAVTATTPSIKEAVQKQVKQLVSNEIQDSYKRVAQNATALGVGDSNLFMDYVKQSERHRAALEAAEAATVKGIHATPSAGNWINGAGVIAAGAVTGHAPAAIAYSTAKYLVKKVMEDKGLPTSAYYLNKIVKDPENLPFIGALVAHNSVRAVNSHLDAVGDLFLNKTNAKRAIQYAINDNIKKVINGQGKTVQQQYKQVSTQIQNLANNPEAMSAHVEPIISTLTGLAPTVAHEYLNTASRAIIYLNQELPQNPHPVPQPFEHQEWTPSDKQIREWDKKLGVVLNPARAIQEIAAGTASKDQIKALQTVYPAYVQAATPRILEAGMKKEAKPSKAALRQLSLLVGSPIGFDMRGLASYQASYTIPGQNPKPQRSAASKIKDLPSWDVNHRTKQ